MIKRVLFNAENKCLLNPTSKIYLEGVTQSAEISMDFENNLVNDVNGKIESTKTSYVSYSTSQKKVGSYSIYMDSAVEDERVVLPSITVTDYPSVNVWFRINPNIPYNQAFFIARLECATSVISLNGVRNSPNTNYDIGAGVNFNGTFDNINVINGIVPDTWYMATIVTRAGSPNNFSFYINAVNQADSGAIGSIGTSIVFTDNKLGRGPSYNPLNYFGYIDQFSVWNRTLQDEEITKLYNSGSGLAYANWDL